MWVASMLIVLVFQRRPEIQRKFDERCQRFNGRSITNCNMPNLAKSESRLLSLDVKSPKVNPSVAIFSLESYPADPAILGTCSKEEETLPEHPAG
jgi:hypothetical protein